LVVLLFGELAYLPHPASNKKKEISMNGLKKSFAVIGLCVVMLFVVGSSVYAKGPTPNRLEIFNATVDWDNNTITVNGENFAAAPQIWLDSYDLTVGAVTTDTTIMANLPDNPKLEPGTYRLFVSRRGFRPDHPEKADILDVTIGTVVLEGPQGEQGPPGEKGDKGDPGVDGKDGLNCWDLNGNGTCDITQDETNEDTDANQVCDALDCQGPQGPQGDPGPPGVAQDFKVVRCFDVYRGTICLW
jgi:hypothetical protein